MKKSTQRWVKSVIVIVLVTGLTFIATEYWTKNVSVPEIPDMEELEVQSDTTGNIETVGEGFIIASIKQNDTVVFAAQFAPEEELKELSTVYYRNYASSRSSSSSNATSYTASGSSGGTASSVQTVYSLDELPGFMPWEYTIPIIGDPTENNICHDCGRRYIGLGMCPYPDCPTNCLFGRNRNTVYITCDICGEVYQDADHCPNPDCPSNQRDTSNDWRYYFQTKTDIDDFYVCPNCGERYLGFYGCPICEQENYEHGADVSNANNFMEPNDEERFWCNTCQSYYYGPCPYHD